MNSFFILGLNYLFLYEVERKGKIVNKQLLWFISYHTQELHSFIRKPLIDCPVCMASVWGTIWFIFGVEGGIMEWIVYCITLAGMNRILKYWI